jgi:hypothetical protein
MKNQIITIILLFCSNILFSQSALSLSFNSTASGRNIAIDYSKQLNSKHELGAGLRININRIRQPDDEANVYYKRLYVTKFYQYIGIQLYHHRSIFKSWQCVKPYLFYNLQMTYSTSRTSSYLPYSYDTNGDVLYKNYIDFFGPFLWIDQYIGIGFKAEIVNSLFIFENLGPGILFIIGDDKSILQNHEKFTWELGFLFSVGLSYDITN